MGPKAKSIAASIILAIGLVAVPGRSQDIAAERRALEQARALSAQADARAARLEAEAEKAESSADRAAAGIAVLAARIQATEAEIDAGEARVKLIDNIRTDQARILAVRQRPIARLVAALQMMARRPLMLSFVQPGSATDLVHIRAVLSVLIPEIRKRTERLRVEIVKSQELKQIAIKAVTLLQRSEVKLAKQRAELATELARHRAQSQRFSAGAIEEQDRAIAMGERARDIVDLIDGLGAAAVTRDALVSLPGPILRPSDPEDEDELPAEQVAGAKRFEAYRLPVSGRLVSGRGEVTASGIRERGLTLATRPGAQVIAPAAGRVVFAGNYRAYGKIVIIDHGGGWTTLLTNMALLDVRVGDQIPDGGPVGRMGTDRPMMKVELRQGATPVDIAPLLK